MIKWSRETRFFSEWLLETSVIIKLKIFKYFAKAAWGKVLYNLKHTPNGTE